MFKLFLFLVLFVSLEAQEAMVTRQKVLMGTFVTLRVDPSHSKLIAPAFRLLKSIENSLSSYNDSSPISKLNKNKTAKLDRYSYEALLLSKNYYKETGAYFNIAIGKITKDLYSFGLNEKIASKKELYGASTALSNLIFDKNEAIISDVIKIDLGGMGKGYAADKVAEFFTKNKVKRAVIALSGDIRCIGECNIEVQNPFDKAGFLATFSMKNSAVSTSGNYRRYVKKKQYNHLINPKTHTSEQNFVSVTLISDKLSSATLDAYATAVSVMPPKKAYSFLKKEPLAYMILQSDKRFLVSSNIDEYVEDLELKEFSF